MTPSSLSCRVLVDGEASGFWNMAVDEILLAQAVAGVASLRVYFWEEATLSLGYFQPHQSRNQVEALAKLPWVRRATGGEAIVHHHELTYSLALPRGEWQPSDRSWMAWMHEIIRSTLAEMAIAVELCVQEERRGEFLCFLHHTLGDLIFLGRKVTGSAQRKQRGALLQHGSILLRQSPWTPQLPGLMELSGTKVTAKELSPLLLETFRHATGWEMIASAWSAEEIDTIRRVMAERYLAPRWNEKR